MSGIGRVLVIVYAIMALAATGRSFVQIAQRFDEAPLAYTLSGVFAALTGSLLLGWSGGAFIGVGDPYLFTRLAAVVKTCPRSSAGTSRCRTANVAARPGA